MNSKEIQELIEFVSKSGVTEVAIEQENFKITIKTGSQSASVPYQPAASSPALSLAHGSPVLVEPGVVRNPAVPDQSRYLTIKSPMIGTFYITAGPDKPAFISEGDEISVGKTVCIIEAMKLFNDIESEVTGRIVKILVENAHPVEYDQPLFLVEPR